MVGVAQQTGRVRRWLTEHRAHGEAAVPPVALEEVQIRPRKDNQLAACSRLLGLVSAEDDYPIPRPPSRLGWLTGEDVVDAWVAEQRGRIQGHVALARVDGDPATAMRWREITGRPASELAEVSRFFVRSGVRGRGLGSALMGTAVEGSRARGLVPVARVVSTSRRGIPFYDQAGWHMVAMLPSGSRGEGLETYLYLAPPDPGRS